MPSYVHRDLDLEKPLKAAYLQMRRFLWLDLLVEAAGEQVTKPQCYARLSLRKFCEKPHINCAFEGCFVQAEAVFELKPTFET